MNKAKKNQNGSEELPRAKDFKLPEILTEDQQELIKVTREVMKSLKEEEVKYGKKTYI